MNRHIVKLIFRVEGVPVAQPRVRAAVVNGKPKMYTPQGPIQAFKDLVRVRFREACKGEPWAGPVRCDLVFVMPRPQSMVWKTKPMPRVFHMIKPDRDNLDKAVMDALTGMAWVDDAQVCQGSIEKWIAAGEEEPHTRIELTPL